ncbi:MAG: hypothetical protein IKW74_02440, partial [Thermoguttaceae bacterium]|nr:hypothetical protein [Thermoguttaceae bacterium]
MQRCFTDKKSRVHESRTTWARKISRFFSRQTGSPVGERYQKIRVESLEERALLSVTPTDYAVIQECYSDQELVSGQSDTNIIELTELTAN